MTDKPTPKELENLFVEETGFDTDDFPAAIFDFASAVLAKWGTPQPSPAEPPAPRGEPVAWLNPWRADQVTTDYDAYGKHGIPLVRQQPVAWAPLTEEQIQDLLLCENPTDEEMRLIRIGWDAANGIKGGQHDAG